MSNSVLSHQSNISSKTFDIKGEFRDNHHTKDQEEFDNDVADFQALFSNLGLNYINDVPNNIKQ